MTRQRRGFAAWNDRVMSAPKDTAKIRPVIEREAGQPDRLLFDEETYRVFESGTLREKVKRARELTPGGRLAIGPQLFDRHIARMRRNLHAENPSWTETQVEAEIDRVLDEARREKREFIDNLPFMKRTPDRSPTA